MIIILWMILGTLSFLLSGLWLGTIVTDYYFGTPIEFRQYLIFIITLATGCSQFYLIYKNLMLQ